MVRRLQRAIVGMKFEAARNGGSRACFYLIVGVNVSVLIVTKGARMR